MKISNLTTSSGAKAANQFNITTKNADYFQSYETVIAMEKDGITTLSPEWKISKTTMKYLKNWLGASSVKEIEKKIKQGLIIVSTNSLTIDN